MSERATQMSKRVTVIDDEPAIVAVMREMLVDAGYEVSALSGATDLAPIRSTRPDVLIIDQMLGAESLPGEKIVALARTDPQLREVPVVFCAGMVSGMRDPDHDPLAPLRMQLLPKPFSVDDLQAAVDAATGAAAA